MDHQKIRVALSRDHVILSKDSSSSSSSSSTLWCDRRDGRLTAGKDFSRDTSLEYTDLGKVWGVVGKICFFTDGDWKLVVVTQASHVDVLPHGGEVYCVDKIGIIPLTVSSTGSTGEIIGMDLPESLSSSLEQSLSGPSLPRLGLEKEKQKEIREREKVEKRLTEALLNMFNDSHSFYFSLNSDLTQSLQRRIESPVDKLRLPIWKQMDDRFFWNKWMLSELIDDQCNDLALSSSWVFPLIQGYVEVRQIPVLSEDTPKVLQADWSMLYREERQRLLLEVEAESGGRGQERGSSGRQGNKEVEMQDMAAVPGKELVIPMKELQTSSGSGYETYSGPSDSDNESPTGFSPVKFTDKRRGEGKVGVAIPEATPKKGGGGGGNRDKDNNGSPAGQDIQAGQTEPMLILFSPDAESKQFLLEPENMDSSIATSMDSHSETFTPNSSHSKSNTTSCQNHTPLTSSGPITSDDLHLPSTDSDVTVVEDRGAAANAGSCDSQPEASVPPSASHDSCSGQPSNNSSSLLYSFKDEPGIEGGVVIDIIDSAGSNGGKGQADGDKNSMSLPLDLPQEVGTRGEQTDGLAAHELSADAEDRSPMGNPFLEAEQSSQKEVPSFTLAIISRRSRYRAGTRYKRRGVDSEGHVANYVETELVLKCGSHVVSYVIIRGSVPVFWSQPGNKYHPLPIIERTVEESQEAFKKHFEEELGNFKELVAVNLVKQTGREKLVADAFEKHVMLMDDPKLSYIVFDFHRSTKGNSSLALQKFLEGTADFVKKLKFCWIDTAQSCAALCSQEGAFRVNCMDCLDRTNVVESILSREVLQSALQKLGVIPFDERLGGSTLVSYQEMWANNGDIISKQYAGTAAMKGDITRYGERKLTGMMKDGYNSAHRYYLNVFRDSYRQVLIDLMQGVNPFEAFSSLPQSMQGMDELEGLEFSVSTPNQLPPPSSSSSSSTANVWTLEKEAAMAEMLTVCRAELFPSVLSAGEEIFPQGLNGWVLMEPPGYSFHGDNKEEEPCVLMHARDKLQLSVAKFNMETKKIICFLRIPMFQIEKIIIGPLGTLIRNTKRIHMRIHYSLIHETSCYFTLTTVHSISTEEDKAILLSIAELLASRQPSIVIQEQKITRKKSPPHKGIVYLMLPEGDHAPPTFSVGETTLKKSQTSPQVTTTHLTTSQENEDEAASHSVPSSPVLKSPHRQKLSHSCNDLLNESNLPTDNSSQPSITVTKPSLTIQGLSARDQEKLYHGLEDSDQEVSELDSESGSEFEIVSSAATRGSTNPMVDVLDGGVGSPPSRESEEEEEVVGEKKSGDVNSVNGGMVRPEDDGGGGIARRKFNRFKDKFRNPFSRSRSPHPEGEEEEEELRKSPSPPEDDKSLSLPTSTTATTTAAEEQGSSQSKLASVRQRFKTNSPNLWRKMRKSSPVGPSEEELARSQARETSKSRIIYIS